MDGGFRGPVDVEYYAIGTTGQQNVLRKGDVFGMFRREGTKEYRLQKAGTSALTATNLAKILTTDTTGETVVATAAATDIPVGVIPIAVTASNYFFMQVGGIASVAVVNSTSVGALLAASGTAGTAQAAPFTAATVQGTIGVLLAGNSSGGAAARDVQLQGLQ